MQNNNKPNDIILMRPKQLARHWGISDYTMSRFLKAFKGTPIIVTATGQGRRPLLNVKLAEWYIGKYKCF